MASTPWSLRSALRSLLGVETKPEEDTDVVADAPNPFQAGTDRIRGVATWLVGALAAVATVMLAGSQLSTIGSLSVAEDGSRLAAAVGAALVAVAAVAYAVYRLTIIQMPGEGTLTDIRNEANDATSVLAVTTAGDSGLRAYRPSVAQLLEDYETLRREEYAAEVAVDAAKAALKDANTDADRTKCEADLATTKKTLKEASAAVAALRPHIVHLAQFASYLSVRKRFEKGRGLVLLAALVAAAAIVAFAWAANPAEPIPATEHAVSQSPAAGRLLLTADGEADLSALLGSDCATDATTTPGIRVIAVSSRKDGVEVVVIPEGACASPVKLTIEKGNGHVVAEESVDLPEE